MEILILKRNSKIDDDKKLAKRAATFEKLIDELKKKEIPPEIISLINQEIETLNSFTGSNHDFKKLLRRAQSNILRKLEKELKIVPKNIYRARWLAIGMASFGVSIGVAFGVSMGNMAFIGIGIPIGMVIGMAIGAGMDKKAFEEGRQLDLEIE